MIQVTRETHETPSEVTERIMHAGGVNIFGEPNYRLVWGWNRLSWLGGKWGDGPVELRLEPKYLPIERWHLEKWLPPESYGSPLTWEMQTTQEEDGIRFPALGPYPSRGEYEHCFTLQGPDGEFLPLSPAAIEYVIHAIEWGNAQPRVKRKEALIEREKQVEKDWNRDADAILDIKGE
jgi:hypothetical protein